MSSNPNDTWPQVKCADPDCREWAEDHAAHGLCECEHPRSIHSDHGKNCYECECEGYEAHRFVDWEHERTTPYTH